jgi:protein TonB
LQEQKLTPELHQKKPQRQEEKKTQSASRDARKSDLAARPLPSLKELLPPVRWEAREGDTSDFDGPVHLNTREPRYMSYFETIKRAIERVWEYPEPALQSGLQGKLILEFTILQDGAMVGPRLIRSSGFLELDQEAMRAVRAASPFRPIPTSIGRNRIDILASFEYYDNRLRYHFTR